MSDAIPWQQPLFLVYDIMTDEKVPLTQERLDGLLRLEQAYADLIGHVKNIHRAFMISRGVSKDVIDKWA